MCIRDSFKILNPNKAIGGFLFFIFACINIWSGIIMCRIGKGTPLPFDCPRQLVNRGPYKDVRIPMAIGGIGLGISVGVFIGSFFTIMLKKKIWPIDSVRSSWTTNQK